MGALPEFSSPETSPRASPHADGVPQSCRGYASRHGTGTPADAARMIDALRYLEGRLESWKVARLDAAAISQGQAPPEAALPLALFVRHFASWLDANPARANEPVDWLIAEALRDCSPELRGRSPEAPHRGA